MQTIWKYTLKSQEYQLIEMPHSARVISAEEQFGEIVVYAVIELPNTSIPWNREFVVLGTGHETEHDLNEYHFLNTVKLENGALMFHVFHK